MSDALLIGGFHAVQAALDDGAEKPRQIWLLDSRQDERARRILAAAQTSLEPQSRSIWAENLRGVQVSFDYYFFR